MKIGGGYLWLKDNVDQKQTKGLVFESLSGDLFVFLLSNENNVPKILQL